MTRNRCLNRAGLLRPHRFISQPVFNLKIVTFGAVRLGMDQLLLVAFRWWLTSAKFASLFLYLTT
ncbi:MAG: hypothetical protein KC547_14875 [Anaerolineae bacterium]|nr:hypothetical protein [Anaerolineae bacterium]